MDKIKLMMVDVDLQIQDLVKLMSRCIKLYKKMDQFIKIFKLIEQKEVTEKRNLEDVTLNKRLFVLIQLHLKENPILPVQFIYKNKNVLEDLKEELKSKGVEVNDDPIHSERRGTRYERQNSASGIIVNSECSIRSPRSAVMPISPDRVVGENESIYSKGSFQVNGDQSTMMGEKTKALLDQIDST